MNRFINSLHQNIKSNNRLVNLEFVDEKDSDIYLDSNEIVIPIPNALVDDNDPIVDIIEDKSSREEAKQFIKFAGWLNRKDIGINVKLEKNKQETKVGITTVIDVVFTINHDFKYTEFKQLIEK